MTIAKEIVDAHQEIGQAIIGFDKEIQSSIGLGKAILSSFIWSFGSFTKDQIMQFPIIISMDIDNDEKRPIIKAIERNYATLVLMGILNTGRVDWDKYETINDFLKEFHDNYDVKISTEAFDVVNAVVNEGYIDENTAMELWESVEDQLDTDLINDMYLPFKRTSAKLERVLETSMDDFRNRFKVKKLEMQVNELTKKNADKDSKIASLTHDDNAKRRVIDNLTDRLRTQGQEFSDRIAKVQSEENIKFREERRKQKFTAKQNELRREFEKQQAVDDRSFKDEQRKFNEEHDKDMANISHKNRLDQQKQASELRMREKANSGEMLQEDKFSAMMPSVLHLEITATKTGVGDWRQGLYVGIKAMPRYIKSSLLISNMVEALQNRSIFKFIKWTKEEEKWYDLLFDVSNAKDESLGKNKWLKALARRAKTNK